MPNESVLPVSLDINYRIVDCAKQLSTSTTVISSWNGLESNYEQIVRHLLQLNNASSNNYNDLSPRAVEALQDLRQTGSFCDVILKSAIDGEELLAHRAILGAISPVFKKMLDTKNAFDAENQTSKTSSSSPVTCSNNILHIEIDDIDGITLKMIADYIYTGLLQPVEVTRACLIYAWANKLNMPNLIESTGQFLRLNVRLSNCVAVYASVIAYQPNGELENSLQWFILRRFHHVIVSSLLELVNLLEEDELLLLLNDDWLNATEEHVFDVIVARLSSNNHETVQSKQDSKLWQSLRYGLLGVDFFFERVSNHPFVPPDIVRAGKEWFNRFVPTIGCGRVQTVQQKIPLDEKTNRPRFPPSFLFAIGGWSNGACTAKCEVYDFSVNEWRRIFSIDNGPRAYQQTLLLNGLVYLLGGFDAIEHYSGCRSFNPCSGEWREIAPMNYRRCYVSSCVLDGKIYAIGGCDKTVRLNHGEVYDPAKNQWTMLPKRMSAKRSDANCVSVSINGQAAIVICGGFDGFNCLATVEMLSFTNNNNNGKQQLESDTATWTRLPSMTTRRSGVAVCSLNGVVYALGGYDGVARLSSVEYFDFSRHEWRMVAPMLHARSNFAVAVFNEKIFVCGGFDGQMTIGNCEIYDPKMDSWSAIRDMIDDRSALSCCLVFGDNKDDCQDAKADDGKTQMSKYAYPRDKLNILVESHLDANIIY